MSGVVEKTGNTRGMPRPFGNVGAERLFSLDFAEPAGKQNSRDDSQTVFAVLHTPYVYSLHQCFVRA